MGIPASRIIVLACLAAWGPDYGWLCFLMGCLMSMFTLRFFRDDE